MEEARRISNSEVGTWLTCKAKYRFAFDMKLEKINKSEALNRGILGHEVLEQYYSCLRDGMSHDAGVVVAVNYLQTVMIDHPEQADMCMELHTLLTRFWDYWRGNPDWKILETESAYDLEITEQFTMPMRLDLLVQEIATGKIYLVDHKFCYDFWNEDDIALSPQFAKYVGALRANGIVVDGCILNQVRYRKLKDNDPEKSFKHTYVKPSDAKIKNTIKEHIQSSVEIVAYRDNTIEERERLSVKVLNKMVCKGCDYKNLCMSELDGGEIDFLIENEYKPNSYDYNKEESTQEGLL